MFSWFFVLRLGACDQRRVMCRLYVPLDGMLASVTWPAGAWSKVSRVETGQESGELPKSMELEYVSSLNSRQAMAAY